MSWQAYVDTQLLSTGAVEEGCILGKTDAAMWACSHNGTHDDHLFCPREYQKDVESAEGKAESVTINEQQDIIGWASGTAAANGLNMNGEKFMVLRTTDAEDGSGAAAIYGKKVRLTTRRETWCAQDAPTTLLSAHLPRPPPACTCDICYASTNIAE